MDASDQGMFDEIVALLQPFNADSIELKPETDISADLKIDSVSDSPKHFIAGTKQPIKQRKPVHFEIVQKPDAHS